MSTALSYAHFCSRCHRRGAVARRVSRGAKIAGGQIPKGEIRVKKLLAILALAAAGFAVWRKIEAGKAERTDWDGVTDPVR